jgi:hypothetical protein
MNINTDFVTAEPTPTSWSGVFGYKPDQPSQLEFLGEMFGVISIKSEVPFDLSNLGSLLQDEVHDSYYGPATGPAELSRFERAVKAVGRRIEQIMERESELAQQGVDFEMMVCVLRNGFLYMGAVGEAKIVVARGEDAAEISGVLIDAELDGFARTGSLQLDPDDRLMLLTSSAFAELKQSGIDQVLADFNVKDKKLKTGCLVMLGYELSDKYFAAESKVEADKEIEVVPTTSAITGALAASRQQTA